MRGNRLLELLIQQHIFNQSNEGKSTAQGKVFTLNLVIDHPDAGVDRCCHQETTVLHPRAPRKVDMMDSLLDLTFNGSSGQTAARHQCHLEVQRSQSGSDTQRNQGYHCQWSGRRCMCWAIYVCVCVHMEGVGVAVCKEKEQIDRAEREMHFSNITLSCHPLRLEKEQHENNRK